MMGNRENDMRPDGSTDKDPPRWMTGFDRATELARDPDGYFARVTAESEAAAAAVVAEREQRHAQARRARLLRWTGLTALAALARHWHVQWSRTR